MLAQDPQAQNLNPRRRKPYCSRLTVRQNPFWMNEGMESSCAGDRRGIPADRAYSLV